MDWDGLELTSTIHVNVLLQALCKKNLNWELSWGVCPHAPAHSCWSWEDCVVSLMVWRTGSLSFEADKPFKTMTNIFPTILLEEKAKKWRRCQS